MTAKKAAENKLISLGIEDINIELLNISIAEAEMYICNFCNTYSVPQELLYTWADMACGKYLTMLQAMGGLDGVIDFDGAVSSISEGDVSVSLDSAQSPEAVFWTAVSGWCNPDAQTLLRFRRLTW